MGKSPTVWMRALRAHTYMGRPQDAGDVYLAHEDHPQWGTAENIINLGFAVRDTPPEMAVREAIRPVESVIPKLPARPGTSDDPPDPNMQPWPTPSATTVDPPFPPARVESVRRPRRRGTTVEAIKRGGVPPVPDTEVQ